MFKAGRPEVAGPGQITAVTVDDHSQAGDPGGRAERLLRGVQNRGPDAFEQVAHLLHLSGGLGDQLLATSAEVPRYLRSLQDVRRYKPSTVSRRLSVVAGFYRTCVIDGVLEHSPADYVRRPTVPPESPTLGLTHLQFEAMLTAARESSNQFDFALVCMLGLLGLRIFEATGSDITDLGEEHGHRVLRVCGKGSKVVLVPLPPAVSRAVDRAAGERAAGPLLLNRRGARMDRHAATRRLRQSRPSQVSACRGCTPTWSGTRS